MDSVGPAREQLEREVDDLRRQLAELTARQNIHTQAMDELRASGDRFRELVESTSDWLWEVDRDGKYTYVSPRVRDLLGREPDDLIGTPLFDIMPPAEAERIAAFFQDILSRAEPFEHLENVCLHVDGREVVMETSAVPVYGPDGALEGYRGVDRDITDRKRAENLIRIQGELAEALSATGKLEEGLRLCLGASLSASGMDCGGIYLVREASGALDMVYHQGLSEGFVADVSHRDAESANARIVMAGKPTYTQYPQLGVPLDKVEKREGLLAIAVIPIRHEDQIIGCLNVASHRLDEVPAFSRGALEAIAAEIGSAITRLRTEEALRASEERYRGVVEHSADLVWRVDMDDRITYVSSIALSMLGYAPAELIGEPVSRVLTEESTQRGVARLQQPKNGELGTEALVHELTYRRKDGSEFIGELRSAPITDAADKTVGIQGITRDITERKRAEQALRESEERFRSLSDSAPVGIWHTDNEGRVLYTNKRWQEITGLTLAESLGPGWSDALHPEDRERVFELWNRCVSEEEGWSGEFRFIATSGDVRWVHTSTAPVRSETGQVIGHVGSNEDITDRKRAEEERERLEEQLRQAQKMEAVGQLAGGIAHDFNNILTVIQGNAELLKMDLPAGGQQARFADEVIKGANRAADLTRQLLAFARKGKWQVTPVDIHDAIAQTVKMLTHSIDRRIEIHMELRASPSVVMGDPTQLQNALLNLGVNARDAMAGGGVLTYATRNVTLTEADCDELPYELTPGDFLEIRVTDTGSGMDPQTRERIFEPFFTTKEVGKGTGLGLAGVYGCVKNHDGSISVASEPGRGATFTILLPLARAGTAATARTVGGDEPSPGTGHVLIVDDEESVRGFVRAALQNLGYTVSSCCDGGEAVAHYRSHHQEIDLVILDLIMPKMSGQDTLRELKKINPHVRVLVSSGFSHTQATHQTLDEGVLGLLYKPFQVTELSRAVAQHIQRDSPR